MRTHLATAPVRLTRPDAPAPFRWTARHMAIMEFVAQYRSVDADQIARAVGGSPRGVASNLRNLFRHGYLERDLIPHFFGEGSPPLVYALARKGARFLTERGHALDRRLDWSFRRVTPSYLAHTIEVAEAMIQFGFACRLPNAPRLIDHHELLPFMPESTRVKRDPFKLAVTVEHNRKPIDLAVVPDRLFKLADVAGSAWGFALELDRGTMDISAKRLVGKSSFRKKLIGYYHAWLQKKHAEAWAFHSFRVLTITPSEKRLANMLKAQREVTRDRAAGLFLYTTRGRLAAHGPFAPIWTSSKDDAVSLLPAAGSR